MFCGEPDKVSNSIKIDTDMFVEANMPSRTKGVTGGSGSVNPEPQIRLNIRLSPDIQHLNGVTR